MQWNSVNTGIVDDFNNDGNLDLILAGGEDNLKPQFSKLDSGFASLLLGRRWKIFFCASKKIRIAFKGDCSILCKSQYEKQYRLFARNQ